MIDALSAAAANPAEPGNVTAPAGLDTAPAVVKSPLVTCNPLATKTQTHATHDSVLSHEAQNNDGDICGLKTRPHQREIQLHHHQTGHQRKKQDRCPPAYAVSKPSQRPCDAGLDRASD